MSTLASETLGISVTGGITSSSGSSSASTGTTLMPTVTRVEPRVDVNPVSVILAISVVFILSLITISSNTMILAAFYRYKRLRTASNCLLASLAVSDFGVGVFMPFGMHLELSGLPDNVEISTVCIAPYCIGIALCSVSVLVTVAIAVDRLTSLAQPLRYKNIITHSSVEKYIVVFWLYSIGVGLSPLIYAHIMGLAQSHGGSCRFDAAIRPPVQIFLILAVWAPSALVLLGCYMYVYLVARAHARAIYTVELSFRHQTQTMALPRYGQTLAVTVGAFLILWLPFQACMLLDIFCGTKILSEWVVVWLGLPILAHSAANPWIYAFHHGDMRLAAMKIAEDVVTRFGIHPSRYGCSPTRRGSNTNLELGEVNKSNETREPPEDCFAAKHFPNFYQREKSKCQVPGEWISSDTDISPEGADSRRRFSASNLTAEIVEENIDDLTKMLHPEYAIDRNHLIDSNHNIDKMKHLRCILDPTFNKIRQLRRFNQKRNCGKNSGRPDEPRFISYQNLNSDEETKSVRQLNAMSDPTLGADVPGPAVMANLMQMSSEDSLLARQRNANLASVSDPGLKIAQSCVGDSRKTRSRLESIRDHGCSVRSLQHERSPLWCRRTDDGDASARRFVSADKFAESKLRGCFVDCGNPERRNLKHQNNRQITLTTNVLANLSDLDERRLADALKIERSSTYSASRTRHEFLRHSESINAIARNCRSRLLEPSRFPDSLAVPVIHSEPPSPFDPLPLDPLVNDGSPDLSPSDNNISNDLVPKNGWSPRFKSGRGNNVRESPANNSRFSDPTISYNLLNLEEPGDSDETDGKVDPAVGVPPETREKPCGATVAPSSVLVPEELAAALLLSTEKCRERRPSGTIFAEHDSTRFSSRRPSDLRWSESSRSQEILSNVNDHHRPPSSYSVNNFETCTSGSDLNDITCLGSFVCPDALTSSLRESFFETPSVPDSDVFTSFEDLENPGTMSPPISATISPLVHSSVSSVNLERRRTGERDGNGQSKSSESVLKTRHRAILRLEASVHRSRPRLRPGRDCILEDSPLKRKLAPLATPTPMDICTPTYDSGNDIKGAPGLGVRV